jgi:hypothetical protein
MAQEEVSRLVVKEQGLKLAQEDLARKEREVWQLNEELTKATHRERELRVSI